MQDDLSFGQRRKPTSLTNSSGSRSSRCCSRRSPTLRLLCLVCLDSLISFIIGIPLCECRDCLIVHQSPGSLVPAEQYGDMTIRGVKACEVAWEARSICKVSIPPRSGRKISSEDKRRGQPSASPPALPSPPPILFTCEA